MVRFVTVCDLRTTLSSPRSVAALLQGRAPRFLSRVVGRNASGWVLLLWTLLVLYPHPVLLIVSVQRAWSPVVDPGAVHDLAATLPDDPRAIEALVNTTLVPYAVPWQTYGVPWFFPTPQEVLARGAGDCQARAVVLASILRAKGIPATFTGSFDHLWVTYPGKQATPPEQSAVAIAAQQTDGTYRFTWPHVVDWKASWAIEKAYFWDAMPAWRFRLLLSGWLAIGLLRRHGRVIGYSPEDTAPNATQSMAGV